MTMAIDWFDAGYGPDGFRECSATGLAIHRSAENPAKLFGLTAVVALLFGGIAAFLVAMTRWEVVGLLGPENFYLTAEDAIAAANGGYTLLHGQSSIAGWRNWSILEYTGQALSANNAADSAIIARIDEYRLMVHRLSDPRGLSDEERDRLIAAARPIYWMITARWARRFIARPSAVLLSAIGRSSP